jgi:hypothetical protein
MYCVAAGCVRRALLSVEVGSGEGDVLVSRLADRGSWAVETQNFLDDGCGQGQFVQLGWIFLQYLDRPLARWADQFVMFCPDPGEDVWVLGQFQQAVLGRKVSVSG